MINPMKNIRLVVGTLLAGFGLHASAAIIYDNSINDLLLRFNPGTVEVADEVRLGGPERFLQRFEIEYFGLRNGTATPTGPFAGNVMGRVRLYVNNGPTTTNGFVSPGAVFFDSGTFAMPFTSERSNFVFTAGLQLPAGGLFMPVGTNFSFSLQFSGMASNDIVGLDLYSPPTTGSSPPDYWENVGGTNWVLKRFPAGSPPVNFAARFTATATVPDSTGIGVFTAGVLSLLVFGRLVTRKNSAKT